LGKSWIGASVYKGPRLPNLAQIVSSLIAALDLIRTHVLLGFGDCFPVFDFDLGEFPSASLCQRRKKGMLGLGWAKPWQALCVGKKRRGLYCRNEREGTALGRWERKWLKRVLIY
jgi:hypothetical protein